MRRQEIAAQNEMSRSRALAAVCPSRYCDDQVTPPFGAVADDTTLACAAESRRGPR